MAEIKKNENLLIKEDEDMEAIIKISKIKNNLINYVSMEDIIDDIRKIIDESENLQFRSQLSREYIDVNRPEFILKVTDKADVYDVKDESDSEIDKYAHSVSEIVYEEVISKVNPTIREALEKDEEFLDFLKEHGESMVDLVMTNIYLVKPSDPKANHISFRLLV